MYTRKGNTTEIEIWIDPSSKAYELYRENKTSELGKHFDLCLIASEKWRK